MKLLLAWAWNGKVRAGPNMLCWIIHLGKQHLYSRHCRIMLHGSLARAVQGITLLNGVHSDWMSPCLVWSLGTISRCCRIAVRAALGRASQSVIANWLWNCTRNWIKASSDWHGFHWIQKQAWNTGWLWNLPEILHRLAITLSISA